MNQHQSLSIVPVVVDGSRPLRRPDAPLFGDLTVRCPASFFFLRKTYGSSSSSCAANVGRQQVGEITRLGLANLVGITAVDQQDVPGLQFGTEHSPALGVWVMMSPR